MHCTCGFSFLASENRNSYEGFAFIRDKDYQKLIGADVEVLKRKDRDSKLVVIARASRYVGTAYLCPECSRLTLSLPGGSGVARYSLEELTN